MPVDDPLKKLKDAIIRGDVPGILEGCMSLSLNLGASDIHIEPRRNNVEFRLRVDGVLRHIVEYPMNMHPGLVSKTKLMANLKIDESRVPQDGRISTWLGEKEVDLRVSTLPTVNGEKIVMRVLDKSKKIPTLDQLGIVGRNLKLFQAAIEQPNGVVLTSGPTGSGKTTTMYSAMSYVNSPEVNIMTLEDPVENQMDGLNQSQMKPLIGYTFASGLRTALRQDPDIIMVGEIRDKETIDIAIEASLTGHLVLSTIHTNSAVETITRILNMKVPDFLLTSAVNLIIAQRLSRKLCPDCKVKTTPSNNAMEKLKEAFKLFKPYEGFDMDLFQHPQFFTHSENGCETCGGLGYKGRMGIYEIMTMSEPIKMAVMKGMPGLEIQKVAQSEGMITLEQDGLIKVMQGITSLEEVYKLVKE
ncbi:type II/IV secretion system protein [bacterium]|nr:type II/IV secretion system protein [bacterium]NCQ55954.1 type II/IV secretion system protein [Candidatus Parcubacteria bacterium]NCS67979.1 type II/IV secretion system protein [Candidatus Peregrinibacteria bacterium]NCS96873.1 type II/IV secretion system protein [bacterium]